MSQPTISSLSAIRRVPPPANEPVRSYAPGSPERARLKQRLDAMARERIDVPLVIGGRAVRTGDTAQAVMPHAHAHVLADWHKAGREQARKIGEVFRAREVPIARVLSSPVCRCLDTARLAFGRAEPWWPLLGGPRAPDQIAARVRQIHEVLGTVPVSC